MHVQNDIMGPVMTTLPQGCALQIVSKQRLNFTNKKDISFKLFLIIIIIIIIRRRRRRRRRIVIIIVFF